MITQLRIGSRASPLAVKQARMVKAAIEKHAPDCKISLHEFTTRGDNEQNKPLSSWGIKGLFTKELQDAMLHGDIDCAVHSVKDMPSLLPDALTLAAMLPRDDVRDAWISKKHPNFQTLPDGAIIGTASVRRAAQVKHLHPNVTIVPLRGNVQTRLNKIESGVAEGTFLSCAGLDRLGIADVITERLPLNVMLPAMAQGTIGIECLSDNTALIELLQKVHCTHTGITVGAERATLQALDGSCKTPIAAHAEINNGQLAMRAQVIAPDGSGLIEKTIEGSAVDFLALGKTLGETLKTAAPKHWLAEAS